MSEVDRAYRVLGLPMGASMKEVEEAYRDLCAVWNPDRFSEEPALREKAKGKLEAINAAFDAVKSYHLEIGTPSGDRRPRPPAGIPSEARLDEGPRRASLYDDLFRERLDKAKKRNPIWLIVPGSIILIVILTLMPWPTDEGGQNEEGLAQDFPKVAEPVSEEAMESGARAEAGRDGVEAIAVVSDEEAETLAKPETNRAAEPTGSPPARLTREPSPEPPPPKGRLADPGRAKPSRPALQRAETAKPPPQKAGPEERQEDSVAQDQAAAEAAARAYDTLVQNSRVAARLVEGLLEDLRFQEWKVISERDGEYLIALIVVRGSDNREIQLIWAVDVVKGTVKALSQAARDLEAGSVS